ncbi:MAG: cyclic nucleotide-binding domain-containing protein [Acidimicrobiales bacterium]
MSKKAGSELEAQLAKTPLFSRTTPKQRKALAKAGKVLPWADGKVGVKEGSKAAAFFLILDGSVDVTRGRTAVNRLRSGDFFGETALLSGGVRNATITAAENCTMFALGRPAFKALVESDPPLALAILQAMADRSAAH